MIETKTEGAGIGDVKSPMAIGVHFNCADSDREEVVQVWASEISNEAQRRGLDISSPDFVLLGVSLKSCGGSATYRTVDDIPLVDVPCPCGDPNHWLIKYQEVS